MSIKLRGGTLALALRLQEVMDDGDGLSANDIRTRLSDAINDQQRGTGKWAYLIDSFGDAESGDVIYSCDGGTYRASYEMTGGPSATKCIIDFAGADDVVPRTVYETEADEAEHLAAMESARSEKLYGESVPLYERFVSKKERDAAGSGDFAGKGKSFPILKAGDVAAAASSIGRAGDGNYSTDVIKKNIIRIAKAKGWTSELPKAWQGGDTEAKETAPSARLGMLKLIESCPFAIDIELREAYAAGNKIKLIAPGPGSSAFYTESALKQAVRDKIFHAGVPMRIDHPTRAEEAARPEGSVKDWGAVLATDAEWSDSHMSGGRDMGPGLYAEIKPFSDHLRTIEEKGPYAGVSIRANGDAVIESGHVVTRQGLPVLEKFTGAEGCDMVTRAGAGGLFLQESARQSAHNQEKSHMTDEEKTLLRTLVEKENRREAITQGAHALDGVSLSEAAKLYIVETVIDRGIPTTTAGSVDTTKLTESIASEARRFAGATGTGPQVRGMGAAAPVEITEAQRAEVKSRAEAEAETYKESWASLLDGNTKLAEYALKGRAS